MYKNKKTGLTGSIITIVILLVLVFTTSINIKNYSKIENVFSKIVMPIQNAFAHLKNKIKGNDSYFANIDVLQKENENLKKQNEELKSKIEELEILKAENSVLREIANLSEEYSSYETVGAYIISKNISNISDIFIINVGTNDGIYENMAVMGENGLVGHVISATKNTAKVMPITDINSSVTGELESSKKNVIIRGNIESNKNLKVDIIQNDTEFFIGDIVETSGLGGIYPKGIKVGTIKEVIETENVTEKYAILEANTDFENLEYVLVIKK